MAPFIALLATLAVVSTAAASVVVLPRGQCNTGSVSCCNSVMSSKDKDATALLAALGIPIGDLTGQVGVQCSPIPTLDVLSGNACTSTPVCCQSTSAGGLVNLGCVPIVL